MEYRKLPTINYSYNDVKEKLKDNVKVSLNFTNNKFIMPISIKIGLKLNSGGDILGEYFPAPFGDIGIIVLNYSEENENSFNQLSFLQHVGVGRFVLDKESLPHVNNSSLLQAANFLAVQNYSSMCFASFDDAELISLKAFAKLPSISKAILVFTKFNAKKIFQFKKIERFQENKSILIITHSSSLKYALSVYNSISGRKKIKIYNEEIYSMAPKEQKIFSDISGWILNN